MSFKVFKDTVCHDCGSRADCTYFKSTLRICPNCLGNRLRELQIKQHETYPSTPIKLVRILGLPGRRDFQAFFPIG